MKFYRNVVWIVLLTLFGCEAAPVSPGPRPRASVSIAYGHAAQDTLAWGESQIDEVVVVVSAVELHACAPQKSSFRFELIPSAHAHVPSSSTRLGVPGATALFDGREGSRVVGELGVPLETFCEAWLIFAPADDDVMNVTSVDDSNLVGSTLVAVGSDGEITSTSAVRMVKVAIDDPNKPRPLSFDKPGSGPMLLFDLAIEPLEEGHAQDELLAEQLLNQITVSMRRFHDGTP